MSPLGDVQPGYLGSLIASAPKTLHSLVDMRGYDWSAAPHDPRGRPAYYEDHIVKVDFSNSKADEGFEVRGAVFEECIFDKSAWWLTVFTKCTFIKCRFDHCRVYNSMFGDKFRDCSFKNLSARGEHFSFGWGSEYKHCNFESVDLRNIGDQVGVRFEDCTISGRLTNGVFRGRRYARKWRLSNPVDLLFSAYLRSVAFLRCDLSGLRLQKFVFERDIIFKDNTVGSQPLFT
jgi:uncharacterized protein YjbI with pentapeptide repeats